MVDFPSTTFVGRSMPKESFYRNLDLNTKQKDKFVSDIQKIRMAYKFSGETLNFSGEGDICEIDILEIELKVQDYSHIIPEIIARNVPRKLIFMFRFEDRIQFAVYFQKLYQTKWFSEEEAVLAMQGSDLDEVWDHFVRQIAVTVFYDSWKELPLDEVLKRQAEVQKLQKEIDKLDRMCRKEVQPRKKYELFKELKEKERNLIKMKEMND